MGAVRQGFYGHVVDPSSRRGLAAVSIPSIFTKHGVGVRSGSLRKSQEVSGSLAWWGGGVDVDVLM
jgi:hypothetical protein